MAQDKDHRSLRWWWLALLLLLSRVGIASAQDAPQASLTAEEQQDEVIKKVCAQSAVTEPCLQAHKRMYELTKNPAFLIPYGQQLLVLGHCRDALEVFRRRERIGDLQVGDPTRGLLAVKIQQAERCLQPPSESLPPSASPPSASPPSASPPSVMRLRERVSGQRWLGIVGWTLLGVGLAGIISGGAVLGAAHRENEALVAQVSQPLWPRDREDTLVMMSQLGPALLIVGGILSAGSVALLSVDRLGRRSPKNKDASPLR